MGIYAHFGLGFTVVIFSLKRLHQLRGGGSWFLLRMASRIAESWGESLGGSFACLYRSEGG